MPNAEYWRQRFEQLEAAQHSLGQQALRQIEEQYRQAERELEAQISRWYMRLAENNGISMAEARRLLSANELAEFKWDVQEYIRRGQENALDGRWLRQLENASAKFHISRLEALKIHTRQSMEELFAGQHGVLNGTLGSIYRSGYYHTAFELQRGFALGWDIAGINQGQLEKILAKPWAVDGRNFSDRIWDNKAKLIAELHNELSRGIMLGENPRKMIDAIASKLNVSRSNAGRLVMTESAYFSSAAQGDCYRELGVEEYQILATLDDRTSDICQEMDGQVFPMQDYEAGVTAPPFHVRCRSTTVPYFADNLGVVGQRAARGADGKTYYVPADMTYKEWKAAFVGGGDKGGLQEVGKGGIIIDIESGTQKLKAAMLDADYDEYLAILNDHSNQSLQNLYANYADGIADIKYSANNGYYQPKTNTLVFSYPQQRYLDNGMAKYSTLAHEYGHYFDDKGIFENLTFNEINVLSAHTRYGSTLFRQRASSCDEFLSAVRKDKERLSSVLQDIRRDLLSSDGSSGVQDAISGMFSGAYGKIVNWGHQESYYNRLYGIAKKVNDHKGLKEAYTELGFDVSNQQKVQRECRIYDTASEMWANILSAEVNGGTELEFVKKYLPNSHQALLTILGRVK